MITKIGYQQRIAFGRDFSVALVKKEPDARPVETKILEALKTDVIDGSMGLNYAQKNALGNRLHWALLNTIIPELENSELTCKELATKLKAIEFPIKPSRFI